MLTQSSLTQSPEDALEPSSEAKAYGAVILAGSAGSRAELEDIPPWMTEPASPIQSPQGMHIYNEAVEADSTDGKAIL